MSTKHRNQLDSKQTVLKLLFYNAKLEIINNSFVKNKMYKQAGKNRTHFDFIFEFIIINDK